MKWGDRSSQKKNVKSAKHGDVKGRKNTQKKWQKKNKEHVNEYQREWRRRNPDKFSASLIRYHEKIINSITTEVQ